MLHKRLITIAIVLSVATVALFAQDYSRLEKIQKERPNNFYEVQQEMNAFFESYPEGVKKSGLKQYKRWEYFMETRLMPDGSFPKGTMILDAYRESIESNHKSPTMQSYKWSLLGPTTVPAPRENARATGIGRINAVEPHPTNDGEIWIAAAAGGVWKTADDGQTWTQKYPNREFFTLGANDISICKSNPQIMYIATGDSYGTGNAGGYQTFSVGVLRSDNGGESWQTTGLTKELHNGYMTTRIICHPNDPNMVLVATSSGIYKTTDGGTNWNRVSPNSSNYYDMELNTEDPNIVYASCYGNRDIYKSNNFGDTWQSKVTIPGAVRVELATSINNPDYVAAVSSAQDAGFNAFYLSVDGGETWDKMSDRTSTGNILGWDHQGKPENKNSQGQGWYDLALEINPDNPANIVVGGINMWESNDGGANFKCISHYRGYYGLPYVHADFHDMNYTSDGDLYITNDGGIYKTTDLSEFDDLSDGLPITQYYWFGSSVQEPDWLVCGAQDNGSVGKKGDEWQIVGEGDGGACLINPENKDIWYYSYVYGRMSRSINAGKTYSTMIDAANDKIEGEDAAWISPMVVDPVNPRKIYVGFNNVWRSSNYGNTDSWQQISNFGNNRWNDLKTLAVYDDVIYAATNNRIYASFNSGYTWENNGGAIHTVNGVITDITIDQNNTKRFWYTLGGFSDGNKVFEYNDGEVKNISGNLMNVPAHAIAWQPDSPDRLYVGTDIGVFYSDYNTGFWERYGTDLPNVIVSKIEVLETHDLIRICTYGKGIWEAPLMDCNLAQPEIEHVGELEFCEGGSVILRAKEDYSSFEWSTGETTKEITVDEPGFYTLTVREGECRASADPVEVIVIDIPDLTISGLKEGALCEGQNTEVELKASAGFTEYEWSTGSTEKTITVTEPGTYSVHAITADGCEADAEYEVLVRPIPESPVIYQQSSILVCVSEDAVEWQWYKYLESSDTWRPVLGANEQKLQLDVEGENSDIGNKYMVEITDKYGCVKMSDELYHVTTSVNELNDGEYVNLIPNPVENNLNVRFLLDNIGPVEITVMDLDGHILYNTAEMSNGKQMSVNIDLSGYAAGAYLINLKSGTGSYSDLIIKQ